MAVDKLPHLLLEVILLLDDLEIIQSFAQKRNFWITAVQHTGYFCHLKTKIFFSFVELMYCCGE